MRSIDWLVVHTAGAYDFKAQQVVYQTTEVIRDYHKRHNGWDDIGYHWVIEKDGSLHPGRPEEVIGAHVGGFNERTIGVCVTGHGDFAAFLPAQLATLVKLGAPPVHKTCPGLLVDMNEIRRLVGDRLAGEVR